jgi:hypothetical protein
MDDKVKKAEWILVKNHEVACPQQVNTLERRCRSSKEGRQESAKRDEGREAGFEVGGYVHYGQNA